PEDRRHPPTRCDVEGFIAPFWDPLLGDQCIDDRVDGSADRLHIPTGTQSHLVLFDCESVWKAPQRFCIIPPQQTDPVITGEERYNARWLVAVAAVNVVEERHESSNLRSAGGAALF